MQRKHIPFAFPSLFVLLVLILPGSPSTAPVRVSSSPRFAKPAATKTGYATGTEAAILGWDSDGDAAIVHAMAASIFAMAKILL
jgi:hypothetical protein